MNQIFHDDEEQFILVLPTEREIGYLRLFPHCFPSAEPLKFIILPDKKAA
jgi:hypothetical protein